MLLPWISLTYHELKTSYQLTLWELTPLETDFFFQNLHYKRNYISQQILDKIYTKRLLTWINWTSWKLNIQWIFPMSIINCTASLNLSLNFRDMLNSFRSSVLWNFSIKFYSNLLKILQNWSFLKIYMKTRVC